MAKLKPTPRILIASSTEGIHVARQLRSNLRHDAEVLVWEQGIFRKSSYALIDLVDDLKNRTHAVCVFTPDDLTHSRARVLASPRDNVVFELGLAMGHLGREYTYILHPKDVNLRIPTDLEGLDTVTYDPEWFEREPSAAMGPAADDIRAAIAHHGTEMPRLVDWNLYSRIASTMTSYFSDAQVCSIEVMFIHSHRWRDNHEADLKTFLKRGGQLRAWLPDTKVAGMTKFLASNFDDGRAIPSFLGEVYEYFARMLKIYPQQVEVRLFKTFPTYSFYVFGDQAIVAMYPTTQEKKDPPAFVVREGGTFWDFLMKDLAVLKKLRPVTLRTLSSRAKDIHA